MKKKINTFYYYANEYRKHITDEDEIEKQNLTEVFWKEIEEMIKQGEIIKITINARTRGGKSTLGITISKKIMSLLRKHRKTPKTNRFTIKNICRDQEEYAKQMRNPNTKNTILLIDEWNALEEAGENSTAIEKMMRVFGDVQAGRYVHTVFCSPRETMDQDSDILLQVYHKDETTGTTSAKLYYKYLERGQIDMQLLGYIEINCWEIVKTWTTKAKKLFYKERNPKEEEQLQKLRRKDLYTNYQYRKYEKIELVTVDGIMQPRKLEYAEAAMKVIQDLKPLAREEDFLNQNVMKKLVKKEYSKKKIATTMLGDEMAAREIEGTLHLYKIYHKTNKQINKAKDDAKRRMELMKLKAKIQELIQDEEAEYKRFKEINQRYHEAKDE